MDVPHQFSPSPCRDNIPRLTMYHYQCVVNSGRIKYIVNHISLAMVVGVNLSMEQ